MTNKARGILPLSSNGVPIQGVMINGKAYPVSGVLNPDGKTASLAIQLAGDQVDISVDLDASSDTVNIAQGEPTKTNKDMSGKVAGSPEIVDITGAWFVSIQNNSDVNLFYGYDGVVYHPLIKRGVDGGGNFTSFDRVTEACKNKTQLYLYTTDGTGEVNLTTYAPDTE